MRYIKNAELREWVKDNLRKAIFQKVRFLLIVSCNIPFFSIKCIINAIYGILSEKTKTYLVMRYELATVSVASPI